MAAQKTKKNKQSLLMRILTARIGAVHLGSARDREYFMENLAMLVGSGMTIISALEAMSKDVDSRGMRDALAVLREDISAGSSLSDALSTAKIFPARQVSLIRIGEQSGRLAQNLKVVAQQQEKDRIFKAKLRSAMIYPVFVLGLTAIIGIGVAWFILPKLATVFSSLHLQLPLITKILIATGLFLDAHGSVVIPSVIVVLAILGYALFRIPGVRTFLQYILFRLPGIGTLVMEVELARFGYLLGTLLNAGLPVTQALRSVQDSTSFVAYRKFYTALRASIEEGNSFKKSFVAYPRGKKYIPIPIQQLVIAGEQSGSLPETFLHINKRFESKIDTTTKDLSVILEPILLVIVWLGVVFVALAVILPIYNLIGGLSQSGTSEPQRPAAAMTQQETQLSTNVQPAGGAIEPVTLSGVQSAHVQSAQQPEGDLPTLTIAQTDLGFLNVRTAPSTSAPILERAPSGTAYPYEAEENGWYEISLTADGAQTGWVFGAYVTLTADTDTDTDTGIPAQADNAQ